MDAADLDGRLEEYSRRYPAMRGGSVVTLCLDEARVVPGWKPFARRVIDPNRIAPWLSGSSAKLLSREVVTSLRGRGMEALAPPFSFREARHAGAEPSAFSDALISRERSAVEHRLRAYLAAGGSRSSGSRRGLRGHPRVIAAAPPHRAGPPDQEPGRPRRALRRVPGALTRQVADAPFPGAFSGSPRAFFSFSAASSASGFPPLIMSWNCER